MSISSILVRYSYICYKPRRRFTRNCRLRLKRSVTVETEETLSLPWLLPEPRGRAMVESAVLLVDEALLIFVALELLANLDDRGLSFASLYQRA